MFFSSLSFLAFVTSTRSASFTAWTSSDCTGITVDQDQVLEPHECFSLAPHSASSFQLSGMQNTNDEGGDRVQLYSDQSCQHHTGTMKHSDYCHPYEHRSLKYIPPQPKNISVSFSHHTGLLGSIRVTNLQAGS